MTIDRRRFLGLAGASALALGATGSMGRMLSGSEADAEAAEAVARGTRWAMLIDVRTCCDLPGCDRCVNACHQAHNVPAIADRRHEVKWIWKERYERAFPSGHHAFAEDGLRTAHLPVLCNHCENPPCTRVCPTQATWKRQDGIVMMDWHRCVGCRYCMAACPYGSRSFNWKDPRPHVGATTASYPTRTRGVVEKCTFCDERLAKGQPPACVEACPNRSMMFGDLADGNGPIRQLLRSRHSIRRKPELGTAPAVYYLV